MQIWKTAGQVGTIEVVSERPSMEQLLEGPATLTVPEAGRFLGLERSAAYAAARRGDLPTIRLGRKRLVVPAARLAELLGVSSG
jgi:excisionase family DNA binding protein